MNKRKTIRIAGITLIVLLIIMALLFVFGNLALNRYLNAEQNKDLGKYLPVSGAFTYEKASINPFWNFPNLALNIKGLKLADSLADEHKYPPLALEKLSLKLKVVDWGKKEIAVESIDLDGLNINLYDDKKGYSNIASLIKKKIKKETVENKKKGISIVSINSTLNISNIKLNKIDKNNGQEASLLIDHVLLKNKAVDSNYQLTLNINQINISDLSAQQALINPINLEEVVANVNLSTSFSNLSLKNILLNKGHIHFLNDSLGQSNYAHLFGTKNKKEATSKNNNKSNKDKLEIAIDGAKVQLKNIDFALINEAKHKHLEAEIKEVETIIHAATDTSLNIALQLDVEQLGFNTLKGAYLAKSVVEGNLHAKLSNGLVSLSGPAVFINTEPFNIEANLYSDKKTPTTLVIEKQDARIETIVPILTNNIQKSIAQYNVDGPFYAKANVLFTPGKKDPRVEIDFKIDNKTIEVKGQTIKKASVSATFVNRLYDDDRQFNESKKNVRLMIHSVQGEFNELQVNSKNAVVLSSPSTGDRIIAQAEITGHAASASQYLKHDNFHFKKGKFKMKTDINGSLTNLDDLISGTNLSLEMDNLEVHYPEGNTVFPLRILEIKKTGEKTIFGIEGFTDKHNRPFYIRGEIDRIESILFPSSENRLRTEANIRASSISWEGIIALFGKDGLFAGVKKDSTVKAKRSMKQTLSGIQESFHPIVRVDIDTVFYGKNIELLHFNTGVKFHDKRTLVLEETSFNIEESKIKLDGEVQINQLDFTKFDFDIELNNLDFNVLMPKFNYFGVHLIEQIKDQPDDMSMEINLSGELDDNAGLRPESINADITYESHATDKFSGSIKLAANPQTKKVDVIFGHSGHPRNFNHLLENDAYRFDKGYYTTSFNFDDNFESIAQMVENSKFTLTIDDAEVYITELDITIPLNRIEVASINNKAYYHLLLRSDELEQEISLDGIVQNIRHFAFKDTKDPYEIDLEISSPRIVWDDLIKVISYQKTNQDSVQNGKAVKESLTKVLNDFNPDVTLNIDTLDYSEKINFNDIHAHAYLDNNILRIDSANISYGKSHVQAKLNADMGHENILPFDMQLQLTNIDMGQTLAHFDYFNVVELKEAKQLEGKIWFDLDMKAEMDLNNQGLNTEKTDALFSVKIEDVIIENLHTIDTITEGLGYEKRFNVLRFAPIETEIKLIGERLEIALTEIQSNAIHAFVEGVIDEQSPENLWISIPIGNLKNPDLETIPEKTGYHDGSRKVYLKYTGNKFDKKGKMKISLRKKKFFQERFRAREFRTYKRENRAARKRWRQNKRAK